MVLISDLKNEFVINLNSKKLISAGIVLGIVVVVFFSYIYALFAFVAPSGDFPLEITKVSVLDSTNQPQITFNEGDLVRINSTLEKALSYVNFPFSYAYYDFVGDTSFKIIVTVIDSNKMPVFIQSTQKNLAPGSVVAEYFDYTIQSGAASGTYKINVMVWSDWLPGGKALSELGWEVTITVT